MKTVTIHGPRSLEIEEQKRRNNRIMKRFLFILAVSLINLCSCNSAGAYELYFGDLHSHTGFSDGKATPDVAWDFARNTAGVDFWSVTDHAEQIDSAGDAKDKHEWDFMWNTSREKTVPGKFVAIAGFEWGTDEIQGHINAINTLKVPKTEAVLRLRQFYKWVYKNPEALIGFNHPSTQGEFVFNQMEFVPQVASQTFYIAVNVDTDFPYYYMALDNGWRVAPSAQQDNHRPDWGAQSSGNLIGVYANELTYNGLIDAFVNRRFYATNNRDMILWLDGGGRLMGSQIKADTVRLTIKITHKAGTAIKDVTILTNGTATLASWEPGAPQAEYQLNVERKDAASRWFVVLVHDTNGRFAVSAPIWLKKSE